MPTPTPAALLTAEEREAIEGRDARPISAFTQVVPSDRPFQAEHDRHRLLQAYSAMEKELDEHRGCAIALEQRYEAISARCADLEREKAAAVGLMQGHALTIKSLEARCAGLEKALELADSYIREHTDHHGDCQLSQSDGDDPCTCDHGFTRIQISAALEAK